MTIGYSSSNDSNTATFETTQDLMKELASLREIKKRQDQVILDHEELLRAEAELRDFIETAAIGLHWVGPDGTILWANEAEFKLLGYTREEYLGRHISDFHADQPVIQDILARLLHGERLRDYPARLLCKDGAIRHVLIDSSALFQNGKFVHTRCFTRDVTDRNQINDALRESERRLQEIVQALPAAVYTTDAEGRITMFNQAAVQFSGRVPELGTDSWCVSWKMYSPDGTPLPHDQCPMALAIKEDRPLRGYEAIAERPDGTRVHFLPYPTPLHDDAGRLKGAVNMLVDITERKRAEEALRQSEERLRRANADLEQFAYSASHDLQEPIRNVAVYAELLSSRYADALDEKGKQCLGFVTDGARRMEMLVKDLLAYTRSGETSDGTARADAAAALAKALSNLAETAREAGAVITHDALPTLHLHEVQLQQLFQNLIGNAIKYRKSDNPPCIHIMAESQGSHWKISVRDNGIGISPEHQERIFGMFKRLHNQKQYSGSGIGLAICQRIVERNGGRIWVESDGPGKGSTFCFIVPVR